MAGSDRIDFLLNGTGTSSKFYFKGGKVAFIAEGTFSSQLVKLQIISPHGTAIDVPNASLSANGMAVVEIPQGQYQAVATATAVYCSMVSVPTITTR